MAIDDDLLFAAQRGDRAAVEEMLAQMYPAVSRIAFALAGREDVGRGVLRFVATQAVRWMGQWRDAQAAERWFYHHTVLIGRRAAHHEVAPGSDTLLGEAADAPYIAFLRAIRSLPQQQREAFILNHGEHLNTRDLAIAMDCSTHAAEMHLKAAEQSLSAMAGEGHVAMTARMSGAYAALAPAEDTLRPTVRSIVKSAIWPRRLRQVTIGVIVVAIVVAAAWVAWRATGK